MIRATIWYERVQEQSDPAVKQAYPEGMAQAIENCIAGEDVRVRKCYLQDPECGITQEILDDTDVLLWWGHVAHNQVPDEKAKMVQEAVLKGMGAIFLHSGHESKPFKLLMGTACTLTWREDGDFERLWVAKPAHPIAKGLGRYIKLDHEETYGEPFDIPEPDVTVFISGYEGGEVFRSGVCYRRGCGKVFYFKPGHETIPTYHNPEIGQVLRNALQWAAPEYRIEKIGCPHVTKPE